MSVRNAFRPAEGRRIAHLFLLLVATILPCACSGPSTTEPGSSSGPPPTGSIQVTASTSGADLDPDGYSVTVGSQTKSIGVNSSVVFGNLTSGSTYTVTLAGVAENCTVTDGGTKTSGSVASGATIQVSFTITCNPLTGSLRISTSTSGTGIDDNGYLVKVGSESRQVGVNDAVTFLGLSPGDHGVELSDVHELCEISGENPRTVEISAGTTASITFAVECTAPPVGAIVFSRGQWHGLLAIEPDGTGLQELTDVGGDPAWSPDGESIVYTAMRTGDSWHQLYRMTVDGDGITRLTEAGLNHSYPAWSPDGSRIAYTRPDYFQEIYVINADGSGSPVNLTNTADQHERSPDWSPDGSKLVFTVARASGQLGLYTLDLTDPEATPQQLTTGRDEEPVWSPDGSKIAFSRRRVTNQFIVDLWIIDVNSGVETRVSEGENERHPSWSPDGQFLVFVSDRGQDGEHIWKLELSTGAFTQLTYQDETSGSTQENPTWRW